MPRQKSLKAKLLSHLALALANPNTETTFHHSTNLQIDIIATDTATRLQLSRPHRYPPCKIGLK